jgi:hypothetical protein
MLQLMKELYQKIYLGYRFHPKRLNATKEKKIEASSSIVTTVI